MTTIKPFKAILPKGDLAEKIACPPYDVLTDVDVKKIVKKNNSSFVKVIRSEVFNKDNPYQEAKNRLEEMIKNGNLTENNEDAFYVYRQTKNDFSVKGIVAKVSIDDYESGVIKKHELTRKEKEEDRIKHFSFTSANTEPVFLTYRSSDEIDSLTWEVIFKQKPLISFHDGDEFLNELWEISDSKEKSVFEKMKKALNEIESLYIADGHHRSASAFNVGKKRRAENPNYDGSEEFNYFLAVLYPSENLRILPYNRVVLKHLNIEFIRDNFQIKNVKSPGSEKLKKHEFLVFDGIWRKIIAKKDVYENKQLPDSLDVNILQNYILSPLLGIEDPRVDKNIKFVGGSKSMSYLEHLASKNEGTAFVLAPVDINDLFEISDEGKIMPPKSTWFDPKIISGLFLRRI